ncbi:MAG TPA: hypothetical protein VGR53_10625 [Nitrososphaerales archaeon]|nr:hypothetical protein [Nitrososphaerales archaeon]
MSKRNKAKEITKREMSKLLGGELPGSILDYLKGNPKNNEGRAILMVTLDKEGWPHAALLSSWEVFAPDNKNVRLATYVGTATTSNLERRTLATIILFDSGKTYYVEGSAVLVRRQMKSDPSNSLFNFKVKSVLEDSIPGVKIKGISFLSRPDVEGHKILRKELVETQYRGRG